MKRVLVIGCPGAGKTYFSKKLSEITNLPVIHMDNLYWHNDKTSVSHEELVEKLLPYLQKDEDDPPPGDGFLPENHRRRLRSGRHAALPPGGHHPRGLLWLCGALRE